MAQLFRCLMLFTLFCFPHKAVAQETPTPDPSGAELTGPESTLEASRTATPIQVDGILDEPVWAEAQVATGFRQRWPAEGAPASERTEIRVAYDDRAIYFGLIMYDREPDKILRSVLERDGRLDQDDLIIISLDTYHDRRSAYLFAMNPLGTQADAHFTNENLVWPDDWEWEGVFESQGRVSNRGWELEIAIPLTTIRFESSPDATMGIAFYRFIRRKNEEVTWPHIPLAFKGTADGGMDQVSRFATLTGLGTLVPGRHLEVKPFVTAGAQKKAGDKESTVLDEVGLDLKYSLTPGLTLDLTYNTDFAQVEADDIQINLTRFGLFYPEKREFFLERAELFQFGNNREADLFFSRRIGLSNDIVAGGRITGQSGPLSIGFLNLQTGKGTDAPGANNTVLRLRGDVLPRATIGSIFTNLQNSDTYRRSAGIDFRYRFLSSSGVGGWVAKTWEKGGDSQGTAAGYLGINLRNDRFNLALDYTNIGNNFEPALGFVRRRDMIRYGVTAGWTPRFETSSWARQLMVRILGNYIEGQKGAKQSDELVQHTQLTFQSGEMILVGLTHKWERLETPFPIRPDVLIPPGDYPFNYAGVLFRMNESRKLSAQGVTHIGDYWNGTWFQYGGGLTWKTGPHLTLAGSFDRREVRLPVENGDFDTTILSLKVLGAVSRKLFANALLQYDNLSETIRANLRFDWIHTPGSDLFVVFDTGYLRGALSDPGLDRWTNRAGVIKLTYLKAF